MNRLLAIEYRKNISYLTFWIILGLHYFFLVSFISNINNFTGSMNISTDQYSDINLSLVPLFRFPDIWQNISYLAGFFKILPGIFIVISVTNEFQFNTIRLNLTSGLSRLEWLISKVLLILIISTVSLVILLGTGLALGFSHGGSLPAAQVLTGMDFLVGYFIEIFFYMILAMFVSILLKRTGISILFLLIYPLLIEPLIRWQTPDSVDRFFPVKAMDQINVFPFPKYFGYTVQDHIPLDSTVITVCWIVILISLSYIILERKDL